MSIGEGKVARRSLGDVHGSVGVAHSSLWKRLFAFLGPAYLVSVGYMDPGNWVTDLAGGAQFGYALLWVLLMSNIMAVILQTLSARLGVVTGHDLAQACRAEYSRPINLVLWLLAEVAIAACDLAEVIGTVRGHGVRHVLVALAPEVRHEEDGSGDPGPGPDDRWLFPGPDPYGPTVGDGHPRRVQAELACWLLVHRDWHPGRNGDATQSLPPLGPGAVAADRQGSSEQGAGVSL